MSANARAWDSSPAVGPGQFWLLTLAGVALLPAVVSTVLRVLPPSDDATALVASFIPYGVLAYAAALLLLLVALARARRRLLLGLGTAGVVVLTALHASWLAPLFVADDRPPTTPAFTVVSLNLYKGLADTDQVMAAARRADVVVLIEATPNALRALAAYGWGTVFPYAVGNLESEISDTVIFSRFPLDGGQLIGPSSFQQWSATLQAPGIGAIRLVAVHPCNPYCGFGRWAREHALVRQTVQPWLDEPLVMVGDFNAVEDHGPMQRLRRDGLRSAADLVGSGWVPTYPANRRFPALLPIDNVLVSPRLTATSVEVLRISGTDHRGLLVQIAGAG